MCSLSPARSDPLGADVVFGRGSLGSYSHPEEPHLDPGRGDKGSFYLMALVLGCSWATVDPTFFPDAPVIFSVRREVLPWRS